MNAKKVWFSFLVTISLICVSISGTKVRDSLSEEIQVWNAPLAELEEIDWIPRVDQTLSGTLFEVGDEEGGRVCHPDCPSGWEVDEYDLWLVNNSNSVARILLDDVGPDDGTSLTTEWCIGDVEIIVETVIGTLYCKVIHDDLSGSLDSGIIWKNGYRHFFRLSPNPSWNNDHVDYTIRYNSDSPDDEGPKEIFGGGKTIDRVFTLTGYVCINDCNSNNLGVDVYDHYTFELLEGEDLSLSIHTYPDPDRGNIRAWLITPEPILGAPYTEVYFDDEEEWRFNLKTHGFGTDAPGRYQLIIHSEESDGEDGMTYEIVADLWWVSSDRDPSADYDKDGWYDTEEGPCGTSPWNVSDVPPDWDEDWICDPDDLDDDGDGVPDQIDACPYSTRWMDRDDTDNDGCHDLEDDCPENPFGWIDYDFDGRCNDEDAFPFDSSRWDENNGNWFGSNIMTIFFLIAVLVAGLSFDHKSRGSLSVFAGARRNYRHRKIIKKQKVLLRRAKGLFVLPKRGASAVGRKASNIASRMTKSQIITQRKRGASAVASKYKRRFPPKSPTSTTQTTSKGPGVVPNTKWGDEEHPRTGEEKEGSSNLGNSKNKKKKKSVTLAERYLGNEADESED